MTKLIDGKSIAQKILRNVAFEVKILRHKGIKLCLAVVIVGSDYASKIYVKNKTRTCESLEIKLITVQLDEKISQIKLKEEITRLNNDKDVHGIIVQLPLPIHLNALEICNLINPSKDVDGFCSASLGKLFLNMASFQPCTAAGVVKMLEFEGVDLLAKNCVVIGKSNMVGKPLALMLLAKGATVTVCSSNTINLKRFTIEAEVLISAVGKAKLVTADMIKKGAVVIDVGINRLKEGKICGDVDFDEVVKKVSLITPVPGGVGPVTVAMLMENLVVAAKIQNGLF